MADRPPLANAELAIMELLWDEGRLTSRAIRERLYRGAQKAQHGTVQRLLQRLEAKGFVARDRALAVSLFSAAISREEYATGQLESLAQRLTGGSLAPLVTHLVEQHRISRHEIERLRKLLDDADAEATGEGRVIELVLQLALSNLVLSVALAVLAYGVDRSGRYPAIAHVLWVLVLVKVLTPPLVMLPLIPGRTQEWMSPAAGLDPAGIDPHAHVASLLGQVMPVLLLVWGIGSASVLAVSLVRVRRFDGLLRRTSRRAPAAVDELAAAVSTQLGLRNRPDILVTSARLSPLTWWTGGRVRVVLPSALCKVIDADALRWVLAHELGHVKRRDHLVRWLEWLACVAFWWNPVVWWARHSLRHDEEVSCDALVVARLDGRPQAYARALLVVVEFLAGPATRPPAIATGMDGGGRLERRFLRIVAQDPEPPVPRRLVASVMSAALVLMTMGVGSAALPSTMMGAPPSGSDLSDGMLDGSGRVPVARPYEPSGAAGGEEGYALLSAEVDATESMRSSGARAKAVGVERVGTGHRDRIVGSAGADFLRGRDGPDLLIGGRGRDELAGGPGADTIRGGPGRDLILGGDGPDTVHGGSGDDVIRTARDVTADMVDCGPGDADRAIVDAADRTTGCEAVFVR